MVVGYSEGHNSGVGYKTIIDDDKACPGYCPNDPKDLTNYYWLWDINDWLDVISGNKQPEDIRPYDYGVLEIPFQKHRFLPIIGATFDDFNKTLWITLSHADNQAGDYKNPPIIAQIKLEN